MTDESILINIRKNMPHSVIKLNLLRLQDSYGNPEVMEVKSFNADVIFAISTESIACVSVDGVTLYEGSTHNDFYGLGTSFSESLEERLKHLKIKESEQVKFFYKTKIIVRHLYPSNAKPEHDTYESFRTIPACTIVNNSDAAQRYWDMSVEEKVEHSKLITFLNSNYEKEVEHDGKELDSSKVLKIAEEYISKFQP